MPRRGRASWWLHSSSFGSHCGSLGGHTDTCSVSRHSIPVSSHWSDRGQEHHVGIWRIGTLNDLLVSVSALVDIRLLGRATQYGELGRHRQATAPAAVAVLKVAFLSSTMLELFAAIGVGDGGGLARLSLFGTIRFGAWRRIPFARGQDVAAAALSGGPGTPARLSAHGTNSVADAVLVDLTDWIDAGDARSSRARQACRDLAGLRLSRCARLRPAGWGLISATSTSRARWKRWRFIGQGTAETSVGDGGCWFLFQFGSWQSQGIPLDAARQPSRLGSARCRQAPHFLNAQLRQRP